MTLEPSSSPSEQLQDPPGLSGSFPILEDIFYLGYTTSEKKTIYKDDKTGVVITVEYRTVTPPEWRDIFDAANRHNAFEAKEITERIETLARAIKTINDMPLLLDNKEVDAYYKEHKRNPTPLEQAKIIMTDKIKSLNILDLLYEGYQEFAKELNENFKEIKKKLNPQKSSSSNSQL